MNAYQRHLALSVKASFKQKWDIVRLGLPQKWVNYGRKRDWEQKGGLSAGSRN